MFASGKTYLLSVLLLLGMAGSVSAQSTPPSSPPPSSPPSSGSGIPTPMFDDRQLREERERERIENELREEQEKELKADLNAGIEAMKAGDYATAEEKFAKILDEVPDHPQTNYLMARVKLQQGQVEDCVSHLNTAVRKDRDFIEARELLALVEATRGNKDAAREQLSALIELRDKCTARKSKCKLDKARLNEAIARVEGVLGS